jgi:hypothetical protein
LQQPTSELKKSFTSVARMSREEEQLSNRPWKRRREIERGDNDREFISKRQYGMGAHIQGGGGRSSGWDDHGSSADHAANRQGHRQDDLRGGNWPTQGYHHQGGGGDYRKGK